MNKERRLGILLIAGFYAFLGVMLVPVGYVTSVASGVKGAPSYAWLYGFANLALGLLMIVAAYGLWAKQSWGRYFAIRVTLILVPIIMWGLIGVFFGGKLSAGHVVSAFLGVVLTLVILSYLRQADIRRMYEPYIFFNVDPDSHARQTWWVVVLHYMDAVGKLLKEHFATVRWPYGLRLRRYFP